MQFPHHLDWEIGAEIDECMGQDPMMLGSIVERLGTERSSRQSIPDTNSSGRHSGNGRTGSSKKLNSEKNIHENHKENSAGPRRSSSISADHVKKTLQNHKGLPANSLIKEEDESES